MEEQREGWPLAPNGWGDRGRTKAWQRMEGCDASAPCSARPRRTGNEAPAKATRLQPSPSIDGLGTAMTARTIQWLMDDPFPGARSNYFVCFLFAKDNYFVVSTPHKNLDALPTRNDGVIRRLRWSWRCSHPLICCWRECSMVLFFSETNELFFWVKLDQIHNRSLCSRAASKANCMHVRTRWAAGQQGIATVYRLTSPAPH